MKHNNSYFLQLTRSIFNDEPYASLSRNAKWLFVVLKELEHRYTSSEKDYFYRSNEELARDAQLSLVTLKKTKSELLKTDLVVSWRAHFIYDKDTPKQKLSEKRITCYRLS